MTAPTFSSDATRWLIDVVLPAKLRKTEELRHLCPCHYGMCGWCGSGAHHRCTTFAQRHRIISPETYIISRAARRAARGRRRPAGAA